MYYSSGVQNPRGPHWLHSTQSEKALALEGRVACACNVTAPEVHQAFPLCSSSSINFRNNREGNYDYPTINRDTCVKEPGVAANLAGGRPAPTLLLEREGIRCCGGGGCARARGSC